MIIFFRASIVRIIKGSFTVFNRHRLSRVSLQRILQRFRLSTLVNHVFVTVSDHFFFPNCKYVRVRGLCFYHRAFVHTDTMISRFCLIHYQVPLSVRQLKDLLSDGVNNDQLRVVVVHLPCR